MSLLEVKNVHKSFGGVHAVQGVSFALEAGELLGLIGPNGAGKSTLFNLLNGQLQPDSGQVWLAGRSLLGCAPREVWLRGVGRTFQVAQVFSSMSVLDNVQMVLLSHARRLYNVWTRASRFAPQQALGLLEQVGMADQADRPASELAYGDVKRLELAMALASAPQLLLMDEPTAGMSPAERHDLMQLVRQVSAERGLAVLFTEHSMDVVFGYAQRVLVMARGHLIAQGSPLDIQADALVQQVYLGQAPATATAGSP